MILQLETARKKFTAVCYAVRGKRNLVGMDCMGKVNRKSIFSNIGQSLSQGKARPFFKVSKRIQEVWFIQAKILVDFQRLDVHIQVFPFRVDLPLFL